MIKILVMKSAPSCGKSTFCRDLVNKEPGQWRRINNDALREACDFSIYSSKNEETIRRMREFLIKDYLTHGFNILHDNVNATTRNFEDICKVVKTLNLDVQVIEKPFYVELDELLSRNAKREGQARVSDEVVKKFWKDLGGAQFAHYHPKVEIFARRNYTLDAPFTPAVQDEQAPHAIISDLDGTLALFAGKRSPYDATNCDLIDTVSPSVAETIKLYYAAGHKIIFCSGREDKYEPETRRFIENHLPNMEYQLFCRKSGDMRKDAIIKEEIYRNNIEGKYFIKFVLDDRNQVVQLWRSLGLVCFQVAPGDF